MNKMSLALIHSPLVDTTTWKYLAPELEQSGYSGAIAQIEDPSDSSSSWWQRHVESAAATLTGLASPYILVGHSGAGPLLPLIGSRLLSPPAGYIFVDAGILWEEDSRLGMMYAEDETWATEFETYLRRGGTFPNWEEALFVEIIPNAELRKALIQSLRPKPFSFFTEPIPVAARWDRIPCAYLQLSDTYKSYATAARAKGWVVDTIEGHHFSMMTDPQQITKAIMALLQKMDLDG